MRGEGGQTNQSINQSNSCFSRVKFNDRTSILLGLLVSLLFDSLNYYRVGLALLFHMHFDCSKGTSGRIAFEAAGHASLKTTTGPDCLMSQEQDIHLQFPPELLITEQVLDKLSRHVEHGLLRFAPCIVQFRIAPRTVVNILEVCSEDTAVALFVRTYFISEYSRAIHLTKNLLRCLMCCW